MRPPRLRVRAELADFPDHPEDVPNVTQSFGGLFKKSSRPPGRTQPKCRKVKTPWQGKIHVVKNGHVTKQLIK